MTVLIITTKRRITLPKAFCEDLKMKTGDQIGLVRTVIDGEPAWILKPHQVDWSWIGSIRTKKNISHKLADIRASIQRGRAKRK